MTVEKTQIGWADIYHRLQERVIPRLVNLATVNIYPIPRGGIPVATMLKGILGNRVILVERPQHAGFALDDIIDSGQTSSSMQANFGIETLALFDKTGPDREYGWLEFPWERMSHEETIGAEENVRRLLQMIGENPDREGLFETPKRVCKALREMTCGYGVDPASVLKVFEDGACDEMVVLRAVPFESMCEHHMLPFTGEATIAYIPNGRIIGLSKLARLLELYSKRLQVQERLTTQITAALDEHLEPLGSACVIRSHHSCMSCRGVRKQGEMVTSSLTGAFKDKPEARAEFLAFA